MSVTKMEQTPTWFNGAVAVLSVIFIIGLFADGQNHLYGSPITFFTESHAVFYAAYLMVAALILEKTIYNYLHGHSWIESVPRSYHLALLGILLFFLGGFGDMFWHQIFGFEASTEALYSPTHLLLGIGGFMFIIGPIRNALSTSKEGWKELWPMTLSAGVVLSVLTFFTMYSHPITQPVSSKLFQLAPTVPGTISPNSGVIIGIMGIMFHTAILIGFSLYLDNNFKLPPGFFVVLYTFNAYIMAFLKFNFRLVPAFVIGGFVADLIYTLYQDKSAFPLIFGFLTPVAIFSIYFGLIAYFSTIVWSVHVWAGAIFLSGITGFLMSYLYKDAKISE